MNVEAMVLSSSVLVAACGGRTVSGQPSTFDDAGDQQAGRTANMGTGGFVTQGTGGRTPVASGGRVSAGSGGRGSGGILVGPAGAGGVLSGAGGQSMITPDSARLVAFVCRNLCSAADDCPSAAPYAGGCNGISHTCLITCEKGCPPGTQALSVAGGCFCYDPRVNAVPQSVNGSCCSTYCGAPYYLPCCNGYACTRDGTCCLGPSCL